MRKPGPRLRKLIGAGILAGLIGFGAIQLIPYGRDHTNPPVLSEPRWDNPVTAELADRACADCHSNRTEWPWYSNIAPISWFVYRDVVNGREEFNYSEMGREDNETEKAAETVEDGEMPPWRYTVNHPEARLDGPEREALIRGLAQTFGTDD